MAPHNAGADVRTQHRLTKPFLWRVHAGTTLGLVKHGWIDAPPSRRRLKPPFPWYAQAVWEAAALGRSAGKQCQGPWMRGKKESQ